MSSTSQGPSEDLGPGDATFDALDGEALRKRGSLKWTATTADIAAWVAESDFGTAPPVTAALHDAVDGGMLGYLPPGPRRALAQACARWHEERYGWAVDADLIHPVADVLEALKITIEHFSRPGSPVIVPTPAYMPFLSAPEQWGRRVLQVPMIDDGARPVLDLDGIDAAFRAGGHLVLLTNPHNPTGRVHTRAELESLATVVERRGGRVFADEIHAPLVYQGHLHLPYASMSPVTAGHTVTATSASKAWNIPGLKCAQVLLSNAADAARWRTIDALATHGASTPGVLANTAAYRGGGRWLDQLLDRLATNRGALIEVLGSAAPLVNHRPPEGTYLAWLDLRAAVAALPPGHRPQEGAAGGLARWLSERTGVTLVDGAACGDAGRGFVRLNLAMPTPMVIEAGHRLAACLDPAAPVRA